MNASTSSTNAHDASDASQTELEEQLDEQGFVGQFGAREHAKVLCFTCRTEFDAALINADDASRVEGESDPDDMAMIIPVTCPQCHTNGTLSVQFGPGASPEESEVIAALTRSNPSTPLTD